MNGQAGTSSSVRKQIAPTSSAPAATAWVQGLPSKPMSSEQQIEALRRVQVQAEQRVRLGNQLLTAAEARITVNQQMLAEVRTETGRLHHEACQEMTTRLDGQNERLAQFENRLNRSMQSLERKVDALRDDWTQMQVQLGRLLRKQDAPLASPRQVGAPAAITLGCTIASVVEQAVEQEAAPPQQPISERPPSRLYADLLQQLRHQSESEPEIEDQPVPPSRN